MKKYCHLCGAKYIEGKEQPWECSGCGNLSYANPKPTVDIALFNDQQQVLISKRGIEPSKGLYDLPGGFVELDEKLEEAIKREIKEELGLGEADFSALEYVTSNLGDYKYSNETVQFLTAIFVAKLKSGTSVSANDDVDSVVFVSVEDLEKYDFSLPIWPEIIRKAHTKLFG